MILAYCARAVCKHQMRHKLNLWGTLSINSDLCHTEFMNLDRVRKVADVIVTALIALVLGFLFSWWLGVLVFLLACTWVIWHRPLEMEATGLRSSTEGREASQQSLVEWMEEEVTYGPSAPGLSNPSQRD